MCEWLAKVILKLFTLVLLYIFDDNCSYTDSSYFLSR